jgi:hypothetical protein
MKESETQLIHHNGENNCLQYIDKFERAGMVQW